ncbi:MAG: extracellular solute-binding protein [Bifidobacteriaceae bacterium]|jgi:raffinose/stachyose/melibiose transport system substrate-binding protein|nr:extracellular solute-binding protein [Bifidobacteriaceae bacterium]
MTSTYSRLSRIALAGLAAAALGLAGCTPGSGDSVDPSSSADTSNGDAAPAGGSSSEDPADTQPPAQEINTDGASMGDVELILWDQEVREGQASQFTTLVEEFQAEYPNITINRVEQSFEDLATTLALALTDPNPPDIVQANNARNDMGAFVEAGQLLDLDPYSEAYGWGERFPETVLKNSRYSSDGKVFGEGTLYGLPQVGEVVGVFYNKTKLAELGLTVPDTWDEFVASLDTAKEKGETPLMLGDVEGWPAVHVFGPIQGAYVPPEEITLLGMGNPGADWTTPENIEAAKQLSDWVAGGYFNEGFLGGDYDAVVEEFANGTGVFLMAGSWVGAVIDEVMGDDAGFFAPPPATAGAPKATTGGTSLPFSVTSGSKNPDAAALFIDFITSDHAMEVLAETGNLPILRTAELAPTTGVWADVYAEFQDVSDNGYLLPYLDWATPTFGDEVLKPGLQDLMAGQKTVEKFCEDLQVDYATFTAGQ